MRRRSSDQAPAYGLRTHDDWRTRWRRWLVLASGPLLVGAGMEACVLLRVPHWRGYTAALVLGALVAVAELVSRYRDSPTTAMASMSAAVYLTVNASAAAGALFFVRLLNWRFGASDDLLPVIQVLVAGLGSAAVFRSSIFTVAAGDQNIAIGPNAILSVILTAADRGVDRQQALSRFRQAHLVMKDISFDEHAEEIGRVALATMQNVTPSEAEAFDHSITALRDPDQAARLSDEAKAWMLGLSLLGIVGAEVLEQITLGILEKARSASPKTSTLADAEILARIEERGGRVTFSELQGFVDLPMGT
jgi:hypothetical protein